MERKIPIKCCLLVKLSMKFSVIVPSFNKSQFIKRTIDSILDQKYKDTEVIVVDGGSRDGTVEILKKYGDKIRWVSEKDNGQTEAINKGMRMATGEIMAYLNSDDTYEKKTLNIVDKYFEDNPKIMVVYGKVHHIDANDGFINIYPSDVANRDSLKVGLPISQPSVFWRRKLWDEVGEFDESLHYGMDYDYWIRITQKHIFSFIDCHLANTRLYPETKTLGKSDLMALELIKINKKHFGLVDDRWILNYIGEKYGKDKKTWIRESFKMIWKVDRRLPSLKTWKIYLTWIKELIS